MLVIKAGIHKMLVRIENREDTDQMLLKNSALLKDALFSNVDFIVFLSCNPSLFLHMHPSFA